MIAFSNGSARQRSSFSRRTDGSDAAATSTVLPTFGGFSGANFANALATAQDSPKGGDLSALWEKTAELVRANGGSARITLNIASGEKVDLRVSVRNGLVTVFVNAGSRAAEEALRSVQDTIARSLLETGLKLHRFHVRRSDTEAQKAKQARAHKNKKHSLTSDQEDREEQS